MIEKIFSISEQLRENISLAYLNNYDMDIALRLVSGVDIWLNTPLRPREASGTSGMKASHNGVMNFSVLDGWWIEGHIEGFTGWSIGPAPTETILVENTDIAVDAEDLYNKLGTDHHTPLLRKPDHMDKNDEECNRKKRLLFQQPPHDATLRHRSIHTVIFFFLIPCLS